MLSLEKGHMFSQWAKALCSHRKTVMCFVSGIRLYTLLLEKSHVVCSRNIAKKVAPSDTVLENTNGANAILAIGTNLRHLLTSP